MLFPGRKQAVPAVYPVAQSHISPESGIITAPVAVLALQETVAVQLEEGFGKQGYAATNGQAVSKAQLGHPGALSFPLRILAPLVASAAQGVKSSCRRRVKAIQPGRQIEYVRKP